MDFRSYLSVKHCIPSGLVSFVCSILLLFVPSAIAQDASVGEQPKISLSSTVHKFGTVMQGTRVQYSFVVKNEGKLPLEILRVQPECGCTALVPEENPIQPGASGRLQATFDTTGFQGYKVKTVRVYTNDPESPSTLLTFQGTVQAEIEADPPRVFFGSLVQGKEASKSFVLKLHGDSPIKVRDILSRSKHISLDRTPAPDGGEAVRVTLDDSIPAGVFRSRVVVRTNSKKTPTVNVPVFARVRGDVEVLPADVSFGLLKGPLREAVTRKVKVVSNVERAFKVLSVTSSNQAVSAVINGKDDSGNYELEIAVRQGTSGPFRAEVAVTTDHPNREQRVVRLPVYGIVSKQGA